MGVRIDSDRTRANLANEKVSVAPWWFTVLAIAWILFCAIGMFRYYRESGFSGTGPLEMDEDGEFESIAATSPRKAP
jgi:hypothetical protein